MPHVHLAVPPMGASSVPPQLGVGYLASALRRRGHRVTLRHADRTRQDPAAFVDEVLALRPDVLGLTVVTMAYPVTRWIAAELARRGARFPIVLGGPHPTALSELSLRETGAVAVVHGEGERSAPDLIDALAAGRPLGGVAGVSFLDVAGRLVSNAAPPLIEDLDQLAPPAWDLMPPRSYPPAPHQLFFRRFPCAPIMTTRGCKYACTYCASAIVWGHRHRRRSIEGIMEEVRRLVGEHGVRELHVVDDDFTASEEHALAFCDALAAAALPLVWSCPNGIRTNTVTPRLARALADSGCYQVGLGIDVVEQRQMRRVHKVRAPEDASRAVALLSREGIETRGFYLLGLDTDTEADVLRTIDVACALPTEHAAFGLFTPLPGAPDFEAFRRGVDLEGFDWSQLSYFVARDTPHLPAARLQSLLRAAVLRFYLRPRTLLGAARSVHPRQVPWLVQGLYRYLTGKDRWRTRFTQSPAKWSPYASAHF